MASRYATRAATGRKKVPAQPSFNLRRYVLTAGPGLLLILGVAIYLLTAEDQEVKEVKRLIQTARERVIAKDVDGCIALLHESYADNLGNDYDRLVAEARRRAPEVSDISIKLRQIEVEVDRGAATAKFEMRFVAKVDDGMGGKVPVIGVSGMRAGIGPNWEAVTVRFLRRGSDWLVAQVNINPVDRRIG